MGLVYICFCSVAVSVKNACGVISKQLLIFTRHILEELETCTRQILEGLILMRQSLVELLMFERQISEQLIFHQNNYFFQDLCLNY